MLPAFFNDPDKRLNFLTNLGLGIAVALGILVAIAHGGTVTVTIAALGASLGAGGVLGFLFGVPGAAQAHISIGRVDTVAVSSGQGAKVVAVNDPTLNIPPVAPQPDVPPADAAVPPLVEAAQPPAAPAPAPAPDQPQAPAIPPAPASTEAAQTTAASNLEQVADWVTKLLLGGGLTQMQRIPPKIWQWSRNVAVGITDGNVTGAPLQAQQAFAAGVLVYGFILGFFSGFLITKLQLGKRVA